MKDKKMYGHGGQAKAGHSGNMYGRKKKMGGGQMYAKGGSVQPVYGSTVADAMPKAGAN